MGIATGDGPHAPRQSSADDRDLYLSNMVAAGAKAVRMDCRAVDTSYDDLVKRAEAHGLRVLVLLPDVTHVQTLALPAVQKYGATVDYELGNEWNLRGVPPSQWVSVHNAAFDQIKAAVPTAKVISCGLGGWGKYASASDGTHWNPLRYLEQAASLRTDVLGWHPYFYGNGWSAAQCATVVPIAGVEWDYSGLAQLAWTPVSVQTIRPGIRVAATEFGVPTLYVADQGGYITAFAKVWEAQPWADDAFFYSGRDEQGISPTEDTFGLYNFGWAAKPGLPAYRAAA